MGDDNGDQPGPADDAAGLASGEGAALTALPTVRMPKSVGSAASAAVPVITNTIPASIRTPSGPHPRQDD